jgi:hypothetical protein
VLSSAAFRAAMLFPSAKNELYERKVRFWINPCLHSRFNTFFVVCSDALSTTTSS